jgi:hypothetical protein
MLFPAKVNFAEIFCLTEFHTPSLPSRHMSADDFAQFWSRRSVGKGPPALSIPRRFEITVLPALPQTRKSKKT